MKGSTFKRCGCTHVVDGKRRQLGRACPKLKRPDGAWNPRHGTWYFGLDVEGVGGKKNRMIRGGYDSSTEAQNALDAVKAKAAKGIVVNDRLTVGEYLREWINGKTDVKPKTIALYTGHIDRYWEPHLGHRRLGELRVAHVAAVFDAINERNEQVRKGRLKRTRRVRIVGASSMQRIRATLRTALSDAVREGLVSVNVASLVKLPSGKSPKPLVWTVEREERWREKVAALVEQGTSYARARDLTPTPCPVMVWRPDHLAVFLDHVADDRMYALWRFLSHRGTRRGEACGLEWHDFNKKSKTVTIERQRVNVDGVIIEDTPKSEAGGRVIALDEGTVDAFAAHRKRQIEERLAWGEAWVDSGKVFTQENGEPLNPEWVSDEFARLIEKCDLPPIRLHDLRHGAASLMLAGGVDIKVVQETLGHATLATTANTYTSVYPDVATAAAEATAAMVPHKPKKGA
jgi:integrase